MRKTTFIRTLMIMLVCTLMLSACSSPEADQSDSPPPASDVSDKASQDASGSGESGSKNTGSSEQSGTYSVTTCIATPDNFSHGETVTIEAKGDSITHMKIVTEVNVNNPNNDFALKSYQYWTPIYEAHYAGTSIAFSADEAAGTWTLDFDVNDDMIEALAEYYVDLSVVKKDSYYSNDLLVTYYEALLYTCEAQDS